MKPVDCLTSLELLRDFVAKFVPVDMYIKNLLIDHIETPNRRLWALREFLKMNEKDFALSLNMTYKEYHAYERSDHPVPREFLQNVAARYSVPIEWLLCECSMLPMPEPKKNI